MMKLADFDVTRKVAKLSNGVRMVVLERPGMPLAIRAAFRSGGRYDPVGQEGLAHFAEHMVVAGTEKFPSKDKLATYIEQYGGIFGATTSSELMNVNVSLGDPGDLDKAVEILNEMLTKSRLDEKTFEMERGSVLREYSKKQSNPAAWLWEVWRDLYFQETLVGRSVLGSEATIKAINLADIKVYFSQRLKADNLTLIVSGGVGSEDVQMSLEGGLRIKGLPVSVSTTKALPCIRANKISIQRYGINDQIDLAFGFRASAVGHPDNAALDLIAIILGGGRASTLNRILRYEKGLVYSVSSYNMEQSDHGSWVTTTACAKKDLNRVLQDIGSELKRVCGGGVTPFELEFAKNKVTKSRRMHLQTSESWVGFQTAAEVFTPERNWTVADYIPEVAEVQLEDLERVAQKYFTSEGWYLALCGDISEDEVAVEF